MAVFSGPEKKPAALPGDNLLLRGRPIFFFSLLCAKKSLTVDSTVRDLHFCAQKSGEGEGETTDGHRFRSRAERRMPPHPRGVVELLRNAGNRAVVREAARNAGLRYNLDNRRERTVFELTRRARKLGILWQRTAVTNINVEFTRRLLAQAARRMPARMPGLHECLAPAAISGATYMLARLTRR